MKRKILSVLLAVCFLLPLGTLSAIAASSTPFQDVKNSDWYANAVSYVYREGLFNGTSSTTFSPNTPMQRVQMMQVLANRTEGYSKAEYAGVSSFVDVPVDHWGCAPVRWAYRNNLADGVGDDRFDPEAALTREQLAVFLYRYAQRTGATTSTSGTRYFTFPDRSAVSTWAVTAMRWAVNRGIINGSDGLLKPGGTATRAEVAQMFLNAAPVLTSTRLLPQEERPDPDFTQSLSDIIDVDFVLDSLAYVVSPQVIYTSNMTTSIWHSMASVWLANAYSAYSPTGYDAPTPIAEEDFLYISNSSCVLSGTALNTAIELFGGDPETVMAELYSYSPHTGSSLDTIRPTGNQIEWYLPGRGGVTITNLWADSLIEQNGEVELTYSFQVGQVGGWTFRYQGKAVLVASDNTLGYSIQLYQCNMIN